jgi:3-dehydroquinate synthase
MQGSFKMEQILIETKSNTYPLYLGEGILESLPQILKTLSFPISKVFVITDGTIAKLYLSKLVSILEHKYDVCTHIVPSGEKAKSFEQYYECQTAALTYGLDRHSLVIAFGGGVVGDLAGFVAATFMRGIRFIQVPTTLLAHDSAVGGKVAINHPLGKNMIGAFHQPEAVVYDISLLKSLPEKEMRSGFAEVIKHALIRDRAFYDWLKAEISSLNELKGEKLQYCIKKGIQIKAAIVAEDERETGVRAHLNFGHTLGHALESELGYGAITHGDAVALGMLFAIWISEQVYSIPLHYHQFVSWFQSFGYPTFLSDNVDPVRLFQRMKGDKKVNAGLVRMVLLKEIGEVQLETVEDERLLTFIKQFALLGLQ